MEFLPRAPDPEEIIIGNDTDEDDGRAEDESHCKKEGEEEVSNVVDETANECTGKEEDTEKSE